MTRLWFVVLVLLLSACTSSSTEPSYYLLRPEISNGTEAITPSKSFAFGELTIASYVDQSGLLLEVTEGQVRAARNHLWAEPVYSGIYTYMQLALSELIEEDLLPGAASPDVHLVNIRIDQMHGTREGDALLVAYWWLSKGKEIYGAHRFAATLPLAEDGYAALARAHETLLGMLAREIAVAMVPAANNTGSD